MAVSLLDLAEQHVPMRKVGSEWHGPCPACGPGKSGPAKTDRFSVKADGRFFCRTCTPSGGDAVAFLKKFENKSCPEAHGLLDRECESTTCPVIEKCSKGKKEAARAPRPLQPPKKRADAEFSPSVATPPEEKWRTRAEKLIDRAHAALLENPDQLAYLAGRGLPRGAVERYRLGWLDKDVYRPRAAWGLPEILRYSDGKPKKLWIPSGIVIPFFNAEGHPERIRVRRHQVREGEARYYWVPGSGNDVPVIGRQSRGFVVVEGDLDAFLVHWHAGDLVGAIPLGSCNPKPKQSAMEALRAALAILVALDFEPRQNERTGRHENPGGQAARWWLDQFPRAKRWPVPAGKDPGEFFQEHGPALREWILGGLPPVFRIPVPAPSETRAAGPAPSDPVEKPETTSDASEPEEGAADPATADYIRGVSRNGIPYIVAETAEILSRAAEAHPGEVPFLQEELRLLKGMDQGRVDAVIRERAALLDVFPGLRVLEGRPVTEPAATMEVQRFDPSRQRAARHGRAQR